MNIKPLLFNIERHITSGEWGYARMLIEKNYKVLSAPEHRKHLSSNAHNLLDHVIKDFEEKKEQRLEKTKDSSQGQEMSAHQRRKLEAERALAERKRIHLIRSVNDYCRDLNWRRARNIIEENFDMLQQEDSRSRLNTEAKVLLETMEQQSV